MGVVYLEQFQPSLLAPFGPREILALGEQETDEIMSNQLDVGSIKR